MRGITICTSVGYGWKKNVFNKGVITPKNSVKSRGITICTLTTKYSQKWRENARYHDLHLFVNSIGTSQKLREIVRYDNLHAPLSTVMQCKCTIKWDHWEG